MGRSRRIWEGVRDGKDYADREHIAGGVRNKEILRSTRMKVMVLVLGRSQGWEGKKMGRVLGEK